MGTQIPHDVRELLRSLPAVDAIARSELVAALPRPAVLRASRRVLDELRTALRDGLAASADATLPAVAARVAAVAEADVAPRHRRVLNGTGVVLHTGIGRAPLAEAARRALLDAAGYAVVEVEPGSGERNQREEIVRELLCELLGVGHALVVNNNAAAVNLCLRAIAGGREAIVSRGELVEIGGGFRMPDVMAEAGCRMVEVGATNRTHLRDYRSAIGADTGLLVKVHPSNFRILGFTGTPELAELAELGREVGVPVFEDLGSGLLVDEPPAPLSGEPRVRDSVDTGAELVCFSGDKLLGGPQCGILVGDRALVARCRSHPLYRAFRCDKLTLAALEATLRIYRDGAPIAEIPTLRAIARQPAELGAAAERLGERLGGVVVPSESFVGSGANPARPIPSFAVALDGGAVLARALRTDPVLPLWPRLADGRLLLDLRTLFDEPADEVAATVERSRVRAV
ncbi:MAG: L-seryl-tRNA(Sec) selenium transferase [Planctomycetes bacterium]|nr:L-seryl-tRNA(Sec) selenium transferase [Planctomycetota bacterium]